MTELQERIVEMVAWWHDFATSHGIRYYACAGTMLGLARHQGFIPWDDDVDVSIPRADYERLLTLPRRHGPYVIESARDGGKGFTYGYGKIYDTRTTIVEHRRGLLRRGVFIDLFQLDGMPGNTHAEVMRNIAPLRRAARLTAAFACLPLPGKPWQRNLVTRAAGLVPNAEGIAQRLAVRLDHMAARHSLDDCQWAGCMTSSGDPRNVMRRECWGEPQEYSFHGHTMWGVERADEYLTNLYGDWRQLPPPEKRVTIHAFDSVDINTPYT